MKQKMGLKGLRNKYKNENDNKVNNINVNSNSSSSSSSNNNVGGDGKVICVAVRASKEISKTGLVWALTHVVRPGDSIKLLLVIPLSKRMWDLSRFISDCTNSQKSLSEEDSSEDQNDIIDSCSKMFVQLHDVYNPDTVKIRIKIVSCSPSGVVSSEAKRIQASWVVLDKQLKCEKKHCIEELNCNIVVMKQQGPEILRLNFANSPQFELETSCSLPPKSGVCLTHKTDEFEQSNGWIRGPVVTPASSPEPESPLTRTDFGTTSISSPSDPESIFSPVIENPFDKSLVRTYGALLENLSRIGRETDVGFLNYRLDLNLSRSVREAIDLTSKAPPGPPPLCSVCRHKSPTFGKPPRWFSYSELEIATRGFSRENFLAEGGFGSVYRGVLPGGQVVAVKHHKSASSQGDAEFCSEVEVLSCAQHRNVVMLIGLCVEEERRLLVYEYICNGSLDSHLYGQDREPLEWAARKRIAVGAARGLRYLHEECRVGCIVHRDLRPNNILLTHDFEPLVGDFGLARWQPDGGKEVETRVIGTFGYLAPEYAQSGQITEKADVYSFGVVLVELVTGRKAMDINRPKGQQSLTEWARPLLENLSSVDELVDPRVRNGFSKQEVQDVLQCASLCIRRDPHSRPRVSQVLRILEGDSDVNSLMKV